MPRECIPVAMNTILVSALSGSLSGSLLDFLSHAGNVGGQGVGLCSEGSVFAPVASRH